MRSMVEGKVLVLMTSIEQIRGGCPSTSLRLVPLPLQGRIL